MDPPRLMAVKAYRGGQWHYLTRDPRQTMRRYPHTRYQRFDWSLRPRMAFIFTNDDTVARVLLLLAAAAMPPGTPLKVVDCDPSLESRSRRAATDMGDTDDI